jgi:hypothetical protein
MASKNQPESEDSSEENDPIIVKKLATKKSALPQTPYMEANIINRYPSMLLIVGKSGSGKSTVANYICCTSEFYGGHFFHHVYLFSPTANHDDLVEHLRLPKDNIITAPTDEKLNALLDEQDALIDQKGIEWVGRNSRVLFIFDDIISHQKFLKGPAMLRLAAMGRHSLASSIVLAQSYTRVPRAVRLQANGVILFPSNQSEVKLLCDDYCPPHTSHPQFMKLIEHATNDAHSFLYINSMDPDPSQRFRRNFDTILTVPTESVIPARATANVSRTSRRSR